VPFVIDAHQHHVPPGFSEELFAYHAGALRPDEYLAAEQSIRFAAMDEDGIAQAVIMPGHGYLRPDGIRDTWRINEALAEYAAASRERFVAAVGIVEPLYGARGRAQLKDFAGLGLAGVTFHTRFQGVTTDSALMQSIVSDMATLGLVPFVHAGQSSDESLWRIMQLARQFPSVTFVVLDGMDGLEQFNEARVCAELAGNTVFDTAGCPDMEFVQRFIQKFGANRLVYGSNTYSRVTPTSKGSPMSGLQALGLPKEDFAAILGGTISRVLARS
jgi:uncharacterized protein